MMPEKLKNSIENLYSVFSKYEINSKIMGCPCCVSDLDKDRIHSKELRDLGIEDLSRYAFKAMTTFGSVDDFKHFLPRIFELSVNDELDFILGKLKYGNWKSWPLEEQKVITEFLFEWWNHSLLNKNYFDSHLFFGIYELTKDLDKLLSYWEFDFRSNNFNVFVRFVDEYYQDIVFKNNEFKNFDENDFNKLLSWINIKSVNLESGFFHFESQDKQFAKEISNALYIFENTAT